MYKLSQENRFVDSFSFFSSKLKKHLFGKIEKYSTLISSLILSVIYTITYNVAKALFVLSVLVLRSNQLFFPCVNSNTLIAWRNPSLGAFSNNKPQKNSDSLHRKASQQKHQLKHHTGGIDPGSNKDIIITSNGRIPHMLPDHRECRITDSLVLNQHAGFTQIAGIAYRNFPSFFPLVIRVSIVPGNGIAKANCFLSLYALFHDLLNVER